MAPPSRVSYSIYIKPGGVPPIVSKILVLSSLMYDISILAHKKTRHGNRRVAHANRAGRVKEGLKLGFTNQLPFPDNNPFGTNSVVNIWNEDFLYYDYLRDLRLKRGYKILRDEQGKFKKMFS